MDGWLTPFSNGSLIKCVYSISAPELEGDDAAKKSGED